MSLNKDIKRVTTHVLQEMKSQNEKISILTAYDFSIAKIVDQAGIDVILVGDSASNVLQAMKLLCLLLGSNDLSRCICNKSK